MAERDAASFRRIRRAGAGSSAEVWRAEDEEGRPVALKIAHASDGAALAREALVTALAISPHIPELLSLGRVVIDGEVAREHPEGRPFLALSWIEGAPLSAALARGADRGRLALRVALDVSDALGALHAAGFAHGDVKPDNIVIATDGSASLVDLGLATDAHAIAIEGATPRYLARGDADLGDARARDRAALGAVIAEAASAGVALSEDPIDAARRASARGDLPPPIDAIVAALLARSPSARPSEEWVARRASAALAREGIAALPSGDRDARRVRAAYLRLRRHEIDRARGTTGEVAPWLDEAIRWAARASMMAARSLPERSALLGPLAPEAIGRWLTLVVGAPASGWPLRSITSVGEAQIARALTDLARRTLPEAWTLRDVERAITLVSPADRDDRAEASIARGPIDPDRAARLAIALSAVPADTIAIEAIEEAEDAPAALAIAAADALRRHGDLGRASALVTRVAVTRAEGAAALAAEVLRRAGDTPRAEEAALIAEAQGGASARRARAVRARIALDRGEIDRAAELATPADLAALAEVAALARAANGDPAGARDLAARCEVLAATAEERARAAGLRGYLEHASDPEAARAAFAAAADYASRAGAVVEEATYRTGEASAAVDRGALGDAIATARRAAKLWEHLGKPALAARALLAVAAAFATLGARHDTIDAAIEARARAVEGADRRAEAYACWAVADVEPVGSIEGAAAACDAIALLEGIATPDDDLYAAARAHRHGALDPDRIAALDRVAGSGSDQATRERGAATNVDRSPGALFDWWGSRAAVLALDASPDRAAVDRALSGLIAMAGVRAPIGAQGRALAAGVDLAERAGRGEAARRLLGALGEAARALVARVGPDHVEAARALAWVRRSEAPDRGMGPEQARDLAALIHSFSDRERLGLLLGRITDALVLWTGVERGLLLLSAPNGKLVPRAARNLAREDLGGDQLALSQTLARRALDAREPVIAVDAAGELSDLHASVHALKLRSVLAVPLIARGQALGVAYLDDRIRRGAFGPREIEWARTIASLAALVIADARDQALLRRAARRATRASAEIAEALAAREAALGAAERELSIARGQRGTRHPYDEIVGQSASIEGMLRLVDRVADADVPVLVSGESGSGKELVARAIHANGARAARPFVGENCGAIPEGLLESTLFGHVRGAFTSADRPRVGLFEVADRGTLFLDEVGEMSLAMQTKLLRVLEDGLVRPVGGERARKVDVRVIAATNRDIEAMVKAKSFREDLYYRLAVVTLRVPSLRERTEDIPLLVQRFIDQHGKGRKVRVSPSAMDRLVAFTWPGNVRQLQNEVRRALVFADDIIDEEHLSPDIGGGPPPVPRETGLNVRRRIDALEAGLLTEALERTSGNQTQAAKLLGLSRFGLQKMMKRLGIGR